MSSSFGEAPPQHQQQHQRLVIKLPERIKKQDDLLNRAINNNDTSTALVTALHLIKYCNRAAIDSLFPPGSSVMSAPWEVASHVSFSIQKNRNNNHNDNDNNASVIRIHQSLTLFPIFLGPRALQRAAQLLSLAQQYLTDVVSKFMIHRNHINYNQNNNDDHNNNNNNSSNSNYERLATAWPFIVTLSHQGIISFYGGRQRLALGYVEAAISMAKNALGIHDGNSDSNNNKNTHSPQQRARRSATASPTARRPSPSPSPPLIHDDGSDRAAGCLSNLRSAALNLMQLMNGRKECAIQLIVLLLNYSRILVSLNKYSHARDSACVAKQMLEDLQQVEVARATHALAEVAMNESQDWPSLLNGRTNLPLLQSFCSFTLADVDVLCRPTSVKVLEASLLLFRDADLAAAAADLGIGNGYRRMILEKATMVAEQLDLVQQTLVREQKLDTAAEFMRNCNRMGESVRMERESLSPYFVKRSGDFTHSTSKSPSPQKPRFGTGSSLSSASSFAVSSAAPSAASAASSSSGSLSSHLHASSVSVATTAATSVLKSALTQRMRRGTSAAASATSAAVSSKSYNNGGNGYFGLGGRRSATPVKPVRVGLQAFQERTNQQVAIVGRALSSSSLQVRSGQGKKSVHFFGTRSPSPFPSI